MPLFRRVLPIQDIVVVRNYCTLSKHREYLTVPFLVAQVEQNFDNATPATRNVCFRAKNYTDYRNIVALCLDIYKAESLQPTAVHYSH